MKNKATILYWIDAALLTLFLGLAATGAIIHWVLPAGSGGHGAARRDPQLLLTLSRHQWGDIHFWIAATMVVLLVVHLALHWGWIKTCTRRIFANSNGVVTRATTASSPASDSLPSHQTVNRS